MKIARRYHRPRTWNRWAGPRRSSPSVTAGEVDDAGVARGGVVEGVERRDGEGEGDARVALAGAETAKCVAAAAETAMEPEVPVMEAVTVSVAVIVWNRRS